MSGIFVTPPLSLTLLLPDLTRLTRKLQGSTGLGLPRVGVTTALHDTRVFISTLRFY